MKKAFDGWSAHTTNFPIASASAVVVATTSLKLGLMKTYMMESDKLAEERGGRKDKVCVSREEGETRRLRRDRRWQRKERQRGKQEGEIGMM